MEQPTKTAIAKLVLAGEQAGFSVEEMIQFLETGAGIEALLQIIGWRLFPFEPCSSHWVM